MFFHLMQNKLLSTDAESEKDQFKGLEMRELNDRKIYFTGPLVERKIVTYFIIKQSYF